MSTQLRPAPALPAPATGTTARVVVLAVFVVAVGATAGLIDPSLLGTATMVMVGGAALVAAYAVLSSPDRIDWLHPLGFPMLYLGFTLVVPFVYVHETGRRLGILLTSSVLSPELAYALLLAFASVTAGIIVGLRRRPRSQPVARDEIDYRLLHRIGLVLLVGVALAQAYLRFKVNVITFDGLGAYGIDSALDRASRAFLLPATMLVAVGSVVRHGRVVWGWSGAWIVAAGGVTLYSGTRGTTLGQVLLLAAIHQTMVRRLSVKKLVAVVAAVLVVLVGVGAARHGKPILPGDQSELYRSVLAPFNAPASNTGILIGMVEDGEPFRLGETYVEGVKYVPPGPLTRMLFGDPEDTGSLTFRRLLSGVGGDSGLGFAYLAEAWLNFGWPGIAVMMFLLGYALGWTATRLDPAATRPRHLAYLFLVALLPFQFRADALAQLKHFVTIALVMTFAYWAARRRHTLAPATHPRQPAPARTSAEGG